MPSSTSMRCKVCSLGCCNCGSICRYSIYKYRNPSERSNIRTGKMTGVMTFSILSIIAVKSFSILSIIIMTTIMPRSVLAIVVVSTIGAMVWCSGGGSSGGTVSGKVGGLGGGDFGGVVYGQGCRMYQSGGIGVTEPKVSWTGMHHSGSHQADERGLKDKKLLTARLFLLFCLGYVKMLLKCNNCHTAYKQTHMHAYVHFIIRSK